MTQRQFSIFNSPLRRGGFTLVEVMVVSVLTAFLAMLLSSCWRGFGPTVTGAIARCRVAQEMNLAVNTLARDLGGSLNSSGGSLGSTRWESRFLDWDCSIPNSLRLCFDNPSNPADLPNDQPTWWSPQTVISYSLERMTNGLGSTPQGPVQFYALVRTVETASPPTTFTVANYITGMQITPGAPLQIQLTFSYPINSPVTNPTTRTCTLKVYKSP